MFLENFYFIILTVIVNLNNFQLFLMKFRCQSFEQITFLNTTNFVDSRRNRQTDKPDSYVFSFRENALKTTKIHAHINIELIVFTPSNP